ncbi:hypothetical protein [Micromonospora sp. NBC_00617]|uniref:hypothetical protein n=1 Tax=Micromonospora sp. NBC_00617 TaxID=2903587 RepID=UPI0030DE9372
MTFTLEPCQCTTYGDRFLADADTLGPRREAYRRCEQCRGAGSVAYPCYRCHRLGRRRAQLVVTVANLDIGAVVSHQVVPGGLDRHEIADIGVSGSMGYPDIAEVVLIKRRQ